MYLKKSLVCLCCIITLLPRIKFARRAPTLTWTLVKSTIRRILQLSRVVKFYLEKSVHGGFGLQCVHIYKHNGDRDR